jgi:ATP-dependent DNA ligase
LRSSMSGLDRSEAGSEASRTNSSTDGELRIDFAEWTGGDKLRHTKFVAMRDDKDPRKVVRET